MSTTTTPRVILRSFDGPRGWEVDVTGACRLHDSFELAGGECVRALWREEAGTVEITVGHSEDPHWDGFRLPVDAIEKVVALLDEVRDASDQREEDRALGRERQLPLESPW